MFGRPGHSEIYKNTKIQLIGVLFSIAVLVPIGVQYKQSVGNPNPFWRYQGQLISQYIVDTGRLPWQNSFEGASYLYSWTNWFTSDFASPLIGAILSQLLGLPVETARSLPIFVFSLLLAQGLIARELTGRDDVFLATIAISVAFKYVQISWISYLERSTIAYTMLFMIIAVLAIDESNRLRRYGLLVVFGATYAIAFQTLVVATMVLFFPAMYVLGLFGREKLLGVRDYFAIFGLGMIYILLINGFIFDVIALFHRIAMSLFSDIADLVSENKSPTTPAPDPGTNPTPTDPSQETPKPQLPPLRTFLLENQPSKLYNLLFKYSNALIVLFPISILFVRLRQHLALLNFGSLRGFYRTISLSKLDILLGTVAIQAAAGFALTPFFNLSNGYSPGLLAFWYGPIFGGIILTWSVYSVGRFAGDQPSTRWRTIATVIVVLVVVVPAGLTTVMKPTTPEHQLNSPSVEDKATVGWTADRTEGRVFADFNTLSLYYTIGGDDKTYIPPPGFPAYSSPNTRERIVQYYYETPASVPAEVYLVSPQMADQGLLHLGPLYTRPMNQVKSTLSQSQIYQKVYSSGSGAVFVNRSRS